MSSFRRNRGLIERLEARRLLASQTFFNNEFISIESDFFPPTPAAPYPSNINVPSLGGTVEKVTVTLSGFGHDRPEDVDLVLVGPGGQSVMLMSDAGLNFSISGRTLTFEDGFGQLPDLSQINSGTYRPTNHDGFDDDVFPSPAPGDAPTSSSLSTFNGVDPSGTWSLYVADDSTFMAGAITNGWSLTITTSGTSVPAPSTPDMSSGSDRGVSDSDNITSDNTPTFTGTATAGSTVKIYANGSQVGSGVASGGNYSITTSVLSDGAYNITATATVSGTESAPSSALSIEIDTAAPSVESRQFNYLTGQNLVYVFSEDVGASLTIGDLVVQNLTQAGNVPGASMSLNYDSGPRTATITFPGFANAILPDADYRAALTSSGITDVAGNAVAASTPLDFFSLAGDANRDRVVDITDLGILATNWQGTGKNFSEGDFNYDTVVDITDLGMLATNWQKQLTLPAAPAASHVARRVSRAIEQIET